MNQTKEAFGTPRSSAAFALESPQFVRALELLLTAVIVVASIVALGTGKR